MEGSQASGDLSLPELALACVGFACYLVVGIFEFSPTLCLQPSGDAVLFLASLKPLTRVESILILVGAALYAWRRGPLCGKWWVVVLVGILYSGGLLVVLLCGWGGSFFPAGLVLGATMKSFGACFLILWGEVLVRANGRVVATVMASSYFLCFGMTGYFSLNESMATSLVVAALPLASMGALVCLSAEFGRPRQEPVGGLVGPLWRSLPLKQLFAVGIFGAAQLLVNSISEQRIGYSVEANTVVAGAVASVAILALVLLMGSRFRVVLLSRMLIPTLIIAMLLVLMAEPGFQRYESYALGAGYAVFRIFAFCLWCYFGKNSSWGASVIVALGQAVSILCNGLENPLEAVLLQGGVVESAVVAAVIVVVLVAALFMLSESDFSAESEGGEAAVLPEAQGSCEGCVESAGRALGLTQRECDICLLLMQGQATDEVCEALFISQATFKTHMRNIYRKAGVHSRPELLGLIREGGVRA